MNYNQFISEWEARQRTMHELSAVVPADKIIGAILDDLRTVQEAENNTLLNLEEAAQLSGYSSTHLGRLIRDRVIPNAGRPNAPKIRLADLPRKATPFSGSHSSPQISSRRQIALSVVRPQQENDNG